MTDGTVYGECACHSSPRYPTKVVSRLHESEPVLDHDGLARSPVRDCPKCGALLPFTELGPRYRPSRTIGGPDRLIWECERCGYTVETATLDGGDR